VAELQASYIQASSHPADTDRLVLEGLMNPAGAPVSGAAYGVGQAANDLKVQAKGTPNMSVDVLSGHGWIDGTEGANQGTYHVYNDATKNLVISAAHATLARKDLVVAKMQDAAYSGATNAWSLAVVTGTPAGSPAEPAVPANAIVLALVDVAAAAASITNANITDRRRRASALGGITVCTSATRPATPYQGQCIYETDTTKVLVYDGAAWVEMLTAGAWTSYTPTLTNLTLGNGTLSAAYHRVGRRINFRFKFILGSTSAVGTSPQFTLPVQAHSDWAINMPIGSCILLDSAVQVYLGCPIMINATTVAMCAVNTAGATGITASTTPSVPFTWGTGDVLMTIGTYEAAS